LLKLPVFVRPLDRQLELLEFNEETRLLRQQYDKTIHQRQIELQ
jgi:hypothetical protein